MGQRELVALLQGALLLLLVCCSFSWCRELVCSVGLWDFLIIYSLAFLLNSSRFQDNKDCHLEILQTATHPQPYVGLSRNLAVGIKATCQFNIAKVSKMVTLIAIFNTLCWIFTPEQLRDSESLNLFRSYIIENNSCIEHCQMTSPL